MAFFCITITNLYASENEKSSRSQEEFRQEIKRTETPCSTDPNLVTVSYTKILTPALTITATYNPTSDAICVKLFDTSRKQNENSTNVTTAKKVEDLDRESITRLASYNTSCRKTFELLQNEFFAGSE